MSEIVTDKIERNDRGMTEGEDNLETRDIAEEIKKIYLEEGLREPKDEVEGLEVQTRAKVLYLLRDGEQSSLVDGEWIFDPQVLSESCIKAAESGFEAIEIGGGRSLEMALNQGFNIFSVLKIVRENLDKAGYSNVDLQVLARGANGMGFEYQDSTVIEAMIKAHEKAGITIIRTFDSLNDIDNINFYGKLHNQGAIAYDRDFSISHYLEFAKLLKEKGANSFCIKDMGGQLEEDTLQELYSGLKKLGLKTTLHMHSTDEEKSFKVIKKALNLGIDGIEVAPLGLSGEASHHPIEKYLTDEALKGKIQEIHEENLTGLNNFIEESFKDKKRQGLSVLFPNITEEEKSNILKKFCEAGLPGGAIPSILSDLQQYAAPKYGNLEQALEIYFKELKQVKIEAGNPPLVTPSADIISKQVIFNIAANQNFNEDSTDINIRYGNIEPRFAALIMGEYGFIKNYESDEIYKPNEILVKKVQEKYPEKENLLENNIHPSEIKERKSMKYYLEKVKNYKQELVASFLEVGADKKTAKLMAQMTLDDFGTEEEIALSFAMPPKGEQKISKKEGDEYIKYMIEQQKIKFRSLQKITSNILKKVNLKNIKLEDNMDIYSLIKSYDGNLLENWEFKNFGIKKEEAKKIVQKYFWMELKNKRESLSCVLKQDKIREPIFENVIADMISQTPFPEKKGLDWQKKNNSK